MRVDRERVVGEVEELQKEKETIERVLPVLVFKIHQINESITQKREEKAIFERALEEMEYAYGNVRVKKRTEKKSIRSYYYWRRKKTN